jgi:uncharacterized protein YjdB
MTVKDDILAHIDSEMAGNDNLYGKLSSRNDELLRLKSYIQSLGIPVSDVAVDPATASLGVGATQQLTAIVYPSDADDKSVTWLSSDESVATVNSSGLVTGVAAGSATITCTSNADNTKKDTCGVTVA